MSGPSFSLCDTQGRAGFHKRSVWVFLWIARHLWGAPSSPFLVGRAEVFRPWYILLVPGSLFHALAGAVGRSSWRCDGVMYRRASLLVLFHRHVW